MPAQKLTPGRLAQIIVMMTLLIVVFFWRTFTHVPVQTEICTQKTTCQMSIGHAQSVKIESDHDGIYLELKNEQKFSVGHTTLTKLEILSKSKIKLAEAWSGKEETLVLELEDKNVEIIFKP